MRLLGAMYCSCRCYGIAIIGLLSSYLSSFLLLLIIHCCHIVIFVIDLIIGLDVMLVLLCLPFDYNKNDNNNNNDNITMTYTTMKMSYYGNNDKHTH